MGIFSKFFRKQTTQTPLEAFISKITLDQAQRTYKSVENPTFQLPAALSTSVLYLAHHFSNSLREMLVSTDSIKTSNGYSYDSVAFESAAFCYYWLMREMLNEDDDDEDEEPKVNDYLECLKISANITSSLIADKVSFSLADDLIINRSIAYSSAEKFKATRPEEKFAQFIISSIQNGSPSMMSSVDISSDLQLHLCAMAYIPIFESTLLTEFKKTARVMFLADQEGLIL